MGNRTNSQHNYIGRTNSPMFDTGDMVINGITEDYCLIRRTLDERYSNEPRHDLSAAILTATNWIWGMMNSYKDVIKKLPESYIEDAIMEAGENIVEAIKSGSKHPVKPEDEGRRIYSSIPWDEIKLAYEMGFPFKKLAERYCVAESVIKSKAKVNNWQINQTVPAKQTVPDKKKLPLTDAQMKMVRELYRAGFSLKEVAGIIAKQE